MALLVGVGKSLGVGRSSVVRDGAEYCTFGESYAGSPDFDAALPRSSEDDGKKRG